MGETPGWVPPGTPASPTVPNSTADWSWLTQLFESAPPHGGSRYDLPQMQESEQQGGGFDLGAWLSSAFGGGGDEDKLFELILDKMGGTGTGTHRSPLDIERINLARYAAHRAMTDPTYRQQLAQSMGWNMNNPHVAYWIQHGTNTPSDPTGSGLGPGETAPGATKTPGATPAPAATTGTPFAPSAWKGRATDPGFTYGAVLPPDIAAKAGVSNQWGVDYELPEGTPLTAPFAGTVIESDFNGPYGYTVVIKLSNGFTYRVAHLQGPGAVVGSTVAVGGQLGLVGSTGNSTGPHVLIEMRDPTGKPIDPTPIIDSLLKGDNAGATKYLGDYSTAAANAPGPVLTTDGHLLYPGSQDSNVFFAAQNLWRKRYGGDPPWAFISSLIAAGNTTTEQIQSVMDQMSSDIPNMNWGQRDALTSDANNAALKAWDRPVPDATIKQLAAQGITTPGQIQGWIMSHPASGIGGDYATIFDAANSQTQALWQQPPSPDLVAHIHQQMQQGPQTGA